MPKLGAHTNTFFFVACSHVQNVNDPTRNEAREIALSINLTESNPYPQSSQQAPKRWPLALMLDPLQEGQSNPTTQKDGDGIQQTKDVASTGGLAKSKNS